MVSPPRFELKGNPGEVVRDLLEIHNAADLPSTYAIRTADWDLDNSGGVKIHPPELQPDSCRPWTRIERARVRLPAKGSRRYRFEINIPENAPSGECRVALLIETADDEGEMFAKAGNIEFPVHGRIAVVIYVVIGDAKPQLSVEGIQFQELNGRMTPVASLHNGGNAHGRPEGLLDVTDAMGRKLDFNVSPLPILPGETRSIPISLATPQGEEPMEYTPPLRLKGLIEWDGGDHRIDTVLGLHSEAETSSPSAPEEKP